MSTAAGQVIRDGKLAGWCLYLGSGDSMNPGIFGTLDEAYRAGTSADREWKKCTCGEDPTNVILYAHYGGGFHWPAKACLSCMAIIGPLSPYPDYYGRGGAPVTDGHPVSMEMIEEAGEA